MEELEGHGWVAGRKKSADERKSWQSWKVTDQRMDGKRNSTDGKTDGRLTCTADEATEGECGVNDATDVRWILVSG